MDALGNELNRLLVDTYRAAGKIEQVMLQELSGGRLSLSEMRAIECVGYVPNDELYQAGLFGKAEINKLGDAKGVANIMNAIWDGYELGSNI